MEENQSSSLFSLNLDAQNSYTLRGMASWAKVLGFVGLIMGILFIILGILVQQAVNNYVEVQKRWLDLATQLPFFGAAPKK